MSVFGVGVLGRTHMGAELLAWRITIYDGAEGGTGSRVVRRGHMRARAANEVVTIAAMAISDQTSAVTMVAEPIPEDGGSAPSEPFVVVWEN